VLRPAAAFPGRRHDNWVVALYVVRFERDVPPIAMSDQLSVRGGLWKESRLGAPSFVSSGAPK
jgi:hypothetical protein